ncbi:putative serine/threonine-protein kinase [Actinoplanes lobatus]|uniref:non-specific serine/threonine protein kinase n=1 Tax=Actinoplanes lobatus TaxID=113568 RepID=A0A7W7HQ43_9ACTN|nr:serine/threonine-protein kinase [Actinoplanes lobatus]MBB4754614.1 serine/threonine-protein kinase PknG [Actinoplanes lobatus]GGN66545.1 putative serine/threonine-protein kinase [Actinoplanes lobatus]GIE42534.1 putative serine/threonine-protein kinase [Actinoplanes lobatus]
MTSCRRDNCPGTIEDGYCDTCGLAPVTTPAPAPAPVPTVVPAVVAGHCNRDGCDGTIDDGYCDTCGLAPVTVPAPRTATAASARASSALSSRTRGSGRTTSSRTGSARRFGGGLVTIEPVRTADPSTAVMTVAEVPESKRFCAKCGNPVGRARGERVARPSGFCPSCGEGFNFTPKLSKGDLVAGQYEVVGPLAHGGLGWVYLAVDRNVSDRWVVLKGLLNSGDEDALAAAVAERRFLAEVEHPNIVKIYNFVEFDGSGYIVMEFVGGKSLKDLLKERRADGAATPLPVDQALAYVLEIMPAFGYLHDRGLIFCDFKPDNVIQSGDQMRLIDLGGVVHVDDEEAAIYGTAGYQAPEMATDGPSPQSDLYTIGRTLAVLTTDFRGYQSTFKDSLPDRGEFEVYRRHESFYRLLVRATRTDADERFADAAEMSEQMLGVLRQVLATDGTPRPAVSRYFTGELRTDLRDEKARWQDLPVPLIDLSDPAAGFLASITAADPKTVLAQLRTAPEDTVEVRLRTLRELIVQGDTAAAEMVRDSLEPDWRVDWYDGILALSTGDPARARQRFDAVWSALPGEPAPQLALGVTAELAGDPAGACGYYDVVSRTDPAYTAAAAGLARCRLANGDRAGAVEAYGRVPGTSSAYPSSQIGAIRALVRSHRTATVDVDSLATAAGLISRLEVEAAQLASLRAELLEQVLRTMDGGTRLTGTVLTTVIGGTPAEKDPERDVRFALESAYREMARATHGAEKIRLVDLANAVRPRTRT